MIVAVAVLIALIFYATVVAISLVVRALLALVLLPMYLRRRW